jgi:MgtC family
MRVLTSDWTASFPPQAVPADIKAKTPDPLLRGFCRSRARPCQSVLGLRPRCVLGRIRIVSAYGFQGVLNDHVVLDPSRVAAQVVSGIGSRFDSVAEVVRGLTTAASIWTVAAIGLAIGGGL